MPGAAGSVPGVPESVGLGWHDGWHGGGTAVSSYLGYFLGPAVLGWMAAVLVIAGGLAWLLRGRLTPGRRVLLFLFLAGLGLVIVTTLLREPWLGACLECLGEWELEKVLTGRVGTDVWLNVVLFLPPAFFATLLWRAPWRTAGAGLLLSLAIEIVQPLVGVGANDLMDLVANTAGALIGAGAGAVVLLVADLIRERRLDPSRLARVVTSLVVGAAVLFGGPAWAATSRQSAAIERLEELFAGTTLADYEANWDGTWAEPFEQFYLDSGRPTVVFREGDGVVRKRYTWNIYFAVRCVYAEWTPEGFTATPRSGAVCTDTLELSP